MADIPRTKVNNTDMANSDKKMECTLQVGFAKFEPHSLCSQKPVQTICIIRFFCTNFQVSEFERGCVQLIAPCERTFMRNNVFKCENPPLYSSLSRAEDSPV